MDIVLAVTVDGDRDIRPVLCFHQTGQDRVLVAPVPALADPRKSVIFTGQAGDDLPCPVPAAVIHKQDSAVRADPACPGQELQLLQEHAGSQRQDLFFVVAGNNDV